MGSRLLHQRRPALYSHVMYFSANSKGATPLTRKRRSSRLRGVASAAVLLSYLIPLLAVLALPTPRSSEEASLFADLRAGICSQQRPQSEDPSQKSKHNGARGNCVLCAHPAACVPDGLTARVWQVLAWKRVRPQLPLIDLLYNDQTPGRVQAPRGPPHLFA